MRDNVAALNPDAMVIEAASPLLVEDPAVLQGERVLAIEDGPTVTHGEMPYGAAALAARDLGATLADPRPFAVGELADTMRRYPHLTEILPAMGYGEQQVRDLEATLQNAFAGGVQAVAIGTPIDLRHLVDIPGPSTRVRYEIQRLAGPDLHEVLAPVLG